VLGWKRPSRLDAADRPTSTIHGARLLDKLRRFA